MSGSNILFLFTGSIACYKACDAVSRLVRRGHRVRAVATEAALRFVGKATLEGLTGQTVLSDMFADGAALEHINLTRWADLAIVCPATANTLNRLAAGLADDLPGALFLAHDRNKPWLIAPAMNPAMWSHPATRAAVERLQGWGVRCLAPGAGRTACGEEGEGRLAEPEAIVAAIETALRRPASTPRLRVLVTSGGTAEPVDGVRVLTNTSTGRTGAGIAEHFARCGHEVVLVRARNSASAAGCREETFFTYAELDSTLDRLLGAERFDAVIHAAAVSDYGVDAVLIDGGVVPAGVNKLPSAASPLLRLRPYPKIVDGLRARARGPLRLVAFKLTRDADGPAREAAVRELFAHSGADFVVHNDLADRGGEPDDFPATIHRANGTVAELCPTRARLAEGLERLLATTPAKA